MEKKVKKTKNISRAMIVALFLIFTSFQTVIGADFDDENSEAMITDIQQGSDVISSDEDIAEEDRAGDDAAEDPEDVTEDFGFKFRSVVREILGLGFDEPITRSACENITDMDVSNKGITSLEGIEYFTNLKRLDCSSNDLGGLNVDACTKLEYLDCSSCRLGYLCVGGEGDSCANPHMGCCTNLKELYCSDNSISDLGLEGCNNLVNLDLSDCIQLQFLYYNGNRLKNLDLSGCTILSIVDCPDNELTNLDLSGCPGVYWVDCSDNQLTSLDLYDTRVYSLDCSSNELTDLDLSHINLSEFDCSDNELTSLDLSDCTYLTRLYCGDNELTSLDLSGCTELEWVDCFDNQLTSLDLSGCTELYHLYCSCNELTNLNISDCSELQDLKCSHNKLTGLYIRDHGHVGLASTCMDIFDCSYNNMRSEQDIQGIKFPYAYEYHVPSLGRLYVFYPQNEPLTQKMTVTPGTLELYVGGNTKRLKVSNSKGKVTYNSSNSEVIKIDSMGNVIPLSKGRATITVTAAGNDFFKAASKKINVIVYGKPDKVKSVKVIPGKSKRTLNISWKKVSSASGYIIRYSYDKNMKGSKTVQVNNGNSTKKTINNLTSKKYVYVQIQAYKKDGHTQIKGVWSAKTKSKGKIK